MNDREKERKNALKNLDIAAKKGIKKLSKENELLVIGLYELNEALKRNSILTIRRFENLIDKKYWNDDALFYISTAIMCGVADTLERAISMYEDFEEGN